LSREIILKIDNSPYYNVLWRTLYVVVVSFAIFIAFRHWAYDDPFITYRYARNLAGGVGFVYNPGEHILSTTTPLFTLLLALMSNFWADIPPMANLIGAISLAVGALFLWDLATSWNTPVVGWVSLLLYPTFPLLLTTLSSETPVYLAFCLGAFASYSRSNYSLTAIFAALAILTRPDGVLVPVLLAADYLLRVRETIPWRAVIVFLALTLPWFIFSSIYFGSPLPVTLVAKQNQGTMVASHWQYWIEAILAFLGVIYLVRHAPRWALILAWTAIYFISYSILQVSRYHWYYAPLIPGFITLIGLGISQLRHIGFHLLPAHKGLFNFTIAALTLLLFIAQVNDLRIQKQFPDPRLTIYRAVGEWLVTNTPINARIGTLEVGMIGYYAQRPMVDFAGLIQPEIAHQLSSHTSYDDAALWAAYQYRPDYLVLHEESFPRLEKNYVSQECRLTQSFNGASYGYSKDIAIYACGELNKS
jgi:hypothetical protein